MSPSEKSGCSSLILPRTDEPKRMKDDCLPLGALGSFFFFAFFFAGFSSGSALRFAGLGAGFSVLGGLSFLAFFVSGLGGASESSPEPSSSSSLELEDSPSPPPGATKSSSGDSSSSSLDSAAAWFLSRCAYASSSSEPESMPSAALRSRSSRAAVSLRSLMLRPLACRNSRRPLYSLRSMDVKECSLPGSLLLPFITILMSKFLVAEPWP
mmetsp:Transcript_7860/g.23392  ORF Transcript_7860/g.23392 Transcript_7860/m.23392 type:complete len:211 (+) Transcript_7860:205-837(+)